MIYFPLVCTNIQSYIVSPQVASTSELLCLPRLTYLYIDLRFYVYLDCDVLHFDSIDQHRRNPEVCKKVIYSLLRGTTLPQRPQACCRGDGNTQFALGRKVNECII